MTGSDDWKRRILLEIGADDERGGIPGSRRIHCRTKKNARLRGRFS
ncbi:hypothetical protein [Solilutibacter silvestris]